MNWVMLPQLFAVSTSSMCQEAPEKLGFWAIAGLSLLCTILVVVVLSVLQKLATIALGLAVAGLGVYLGYLPEIANGWGWVAAIGGVVGGIGFSVIYAFFDNEEVEMAGKMAAMDAKLDLMDKKLNLLLKIYTLKAAEKAEVGNEEAVVPSQPEVAE